MNDNVVSIADYSKEGWASGKVRCLACQHEWIATAPCGTVWLECPGCGLLRGAFKAPFSPAEGELVFRCNICGSEYLYATPTALRCAGCGIRHRPFD